MSSKNQRIQESKQMLARLLYVLDDFVLERLLDDIEHTAGIILTEKEAHSLNKLLPALDKTMKIKGFDNTPTDQEER